MLDLSPRDLFKSFNIVGDLCPLLLCAVIVTAVNRCLKKPFL